MKRTLSLLLSLCMLLSLLAAPSFAADPDGKVVHIQLNNGTAEIGTTDSTAENAIHAKDTFEVPITVPEDGSSAEFGALTIDVYYRQAEVKCLTVTAGTSWDDFGAGSLIANEKSTIQRVGETLTFSYDEENPSEYGKATLTFMVSTSKTAFSRTGELAVLKFQVADDIETTDSVIRMHVVRATQFDDTVVSDPEATDPEVTVHIVGSAPKLTKLQIDGKEANETDKPATLTVDGKAAVADIPLAAISNIDKEITTGITWTKDRPDDDGVEIVESPAGSGKYVLQVSNKAKAQDYTITATTDGENAVGEALKAKLTVSRADPEATELKVLLNDEEIELAGEDSAQTYAPQTVAAGEAAKVYTVAVYDQYDDKMNVTGSFAAVGDYTENGTTWYREQINRGTPSSLSMGTNYGTNPTQKGLVTAVYEGVASKTFVIVGTAISYDFDGVDKTAEELTYGVTNEDTVTLPAAATNAYGEDYDDLHLAEFTVGEAPNAVTYVGYLEVLNPDDLPDVANDNQVTVKYTILGVKKTETDDDTGEETITLDTDTDYAGVSFEKTFTVAVANPLPLKVTFDTAENLTYNGQVQEPEYTVEAKDEAHPIPEDQEPVVTVTGGQKNAREDISISATLAYVNGGKTENYVLAEDDAKDTYTIDPKKVTVDGFYAADKTYGEVGTSDVVILKDDKVVISGVVGDDSLTIGETKGQYTDVNANINNTAKQKNLVTITTWGALTAGDSNTDVRNYELDQGNSQTAADGVIDQKVMTETMVPDVAAETRVYKQAAWEPEVTPSDSAEKATITSDDYDIDWEDNVNAGTAKVVITPKGNYKGDPIEKTFTIDQVELKESDFDATASKVTSFAWLSDGSASVTAADVIITFPGTTDKVPLKLNTSDATNDYTFGTLEAVYAGTNNDVLVGYTVPIVLNGNYKYAENESFSLTINKPRYGDVNLSGGKDVNDAQYALYMAADLIPPNAVRGGNLDESFETWSDEQRIRADVDKDPGVTSSDALLILKWVAGVLEDNVEEANQKFPIEK